MDAVLAIFVWANSAIDNVIKIIKIESLVFFWIKYASQKTFATLSTYQEMERLQSSSHVKIYFYKKKKIKNQKIKIFILSLYEHGSPIRKE